MVLQTISRPLRAFGLATVVAAILGLSASASAQRSPVGTWVANAGGTQVALVLNADGTGTLGNEGGRWSRRGTQIVLTDNAGDSAVAQFDGRSITFTIEGTTLRFTRRGRSAATPSPQAGATSRAAPFNPKKKLRGKTVRPRGSGASFTVPRGWKHGYSGDEYQLAPRRHRGKAGLALSRKMLSASQQRMSVQAGLRAYATELVGDARVQVISGPDAFSVGGKRAGRLILRGNVNGTQVEGYLGVVVDGSWAFLVHGLYTTSIAEELRAGADTLLATLKVKAPAPNRKLMQRMVGCWDRYYGNSGGTGSASTQTQYRLNANGTWTYSYYMSVSSGGGSVFDKDRDGGSWAAFGNTLYLQSNKGKDRELAISKRGAFIHFSGTRYLRCS